MKTLTLIISLALLTACGKPSESAPNSTLPKGACFGPGNGTWKMSPFNVTDPSFTNPYYLTLKDDCTGSTTYCNEKFTYVTFANSNNVTVNTFSTTGGPECLAVGSKACTATFMGDNDHLEINCGSGKTINHIYVRQ
jgi:hypothetical protein